MDILKCIKRIFGKKKPEEPIKFHPEEKRLLEKYIANQRELKQLEQKNQRTTKRLGGLIDKGAPQELVETVRNLISERTKKIQKIRRWMIEKNGLLKKALAKKAQ